MFKNLFLLVCILLIGNSALADSLPTFKATTNSASKINAASFKVNIDKTQSQKAPKTIYSSELSNFQYDEANYHYNKFEKYLKNNLDYANTSTNKY